MKNLYFLKGWNLYANRTLKPTGTDIKGFLIDHPSIEYVLKPSVNFNPSDGTKTAVTTNWSESWTPSYVFVVDENDITIVSSWFVMEFERNLVGQYRAFLKRDVLNDYMDETLSATAYIEKGSVPLSSPLLFNSENVGLNQIKKSETPLKDTTNSAWIVGYVSKDLWVDRAGTGENETVIPAPKTVTSNLKVDVNFTAATFPFPHLLPNEAGERIVRTSVNEAVIGFRVNNSKDYVAHLLAPNYRIAPGDIPNIPMPSLFNGKPVFNLDNNDFQAMEAEAYRDIGAMRPSEVVEFLNLDGKTVQTASGQTFAIKIKRKQGAHLFTGMYGSGSTYALVLRDNTEGATFLTGGQLLLTATYEEAIIEFVAYTGGNLLTTIRNERLRCQDAPYDIFAIPYHAIPVTYMRDVAPHTFTADPESALAIAQAIQTQMGSYVYDVQILPYCPVLGIGTGEGINIAALGNTSMAYELITLGGLVTNVLLWATKSIGSVTIPYSHPVPNEPIPLKVANTTQLTRFCSPNYAGMFEMSAAKNKGIDYVVANYTYKPFNPFIQVAPNFKGLYGASFNDARGLICGGDFSLAKLDNAWTSYELQNKNYQAIFDRNIQSMDVMHRYNRAELIVGGIAGTVGGVTQGAIAGGLTGKGLVGVAIGGAAGGVASAIGGVADYALNEARYKEQRAFTVDQFGLQLDNIKAIPTTISKTTALTNNNKLWPFVEEYDCTDEEKEALQAKLIYDGMTVGVVGTFYDYVIEGTNSYVKGRIIRFPVEFTDDDHLANTIFNEALMGFYVGTYLEA